MECFKNARFNYIAYVSHLNQIYFIKYLQLIFLICFCITLTPRLVGLLIITYLWFKTSFLWGSKSAKKYLGFQGKQDTKYFKKVAILRIYLLDICLYSCLVVFYGKLGSVYHTFTYFSIEVVTFRSQTFKSSMNVESESICGLPYFLTNYLLYLFENGVWV